MMEIRRTIENTSLFCGLPVCLKDAYSIFRNVRWYQHANEVMASLMEASYLAAASHPHASYLTEMYAEIANPM